MPAPIDVQVSGADLEAPFSAATELARKIRRIRGVNDVMIPQDLDNPALHIDIDIDRVRASELGLSEKEVVSNLITAVASNQMIAPTFWTDPKSNNDYYLTVQYPEKLIKDIPDLKQIPIHGSGQTRATTLDAVGNISRVESPTKVDHYSLRKVIDAYVSLTGEDLGRVASDIEQLIANANLPKGVRIDLRGMVQGMRASFRSFALGTVAQL